MNVAIIGCGVQGRRHARAYAAAGHQISYCCDTQTQAAEALAAAYQGPGYEPAVIQWRDDLMPTLNVDIVSIASYDSAHGRQVLAALEADKHILVEKPLCTSFRELTHLRLTWERSEYGGVLMCNFPLRDVSRFQHLKKMIEAEELGEVYAFEADYCWSRLGKLTEGWRGRDSDYNSYVGGAIHLVDLMLWATGQRPSSMSAAGNGICSRGSQYQSNDYIAAIYLFPSGMIGRITMNSGSCPPHRHLIRVYGTDGEVSSDGAHFTWVTRAGERETRLLLSSEDDTRIPFFLSCVNSTERYQPEFDSMVATLAVVESLNLNREVKINYAL